MLDGSEKRCPGCHSRLRSKRSKPIILGEDSRITSRPTLLLEREMRATEEIVGGRATQGIFLAGESSVVLEEEEQAMLAESRRQQAAREAAAKSGSGNGTPGTNTAAKPL